MLDEKVPLRVGLSRRRRLFSRKNDQRVGNGFTFIGDLSLSFAFDNTKGTSSVRVNDQ